MTKVERDYVAFMMSAAAEHCANAAEAAREGQSIRLLTLLDETSRMLQMAAVAAGCHGCDIAGDGLDDTPPFRSL